MTTGATAANGPSALGAVLARSGATLAAGLARVWPVGNESEVDPRLLLESWDVVADGRHNSNTDMILWRDRLLLVHDTRPYHLGTPESRLVVRSSKDGHQWETLAELAVAGKDIRDPKLAVIGGRLHLYALPNSGTYAVPESTVLATSDDAVRWSPRHWPHRPKRPTH